VIVSGLSGNEIFCLAQKGFAPGELVVGNSVQSVGLAGGILSAGRQLAGGEITQFTSLISEGRHAAIARMEAEARKQGATGVSGVSSDLRSMAGYTEFLSQGTAIHLRGAGAPAPAGGAGGVAFFSSATSGIELYSHLDCGYVPRKFVMGNVAYALGLGRGIAGSLRTLARGEVVEFSRMYNDIRHVALERLRAEAAQMGANAVVDVNVQLLPFGPGAVELLMTGTASYHPALSSGPVRPDQVVTSELTGEELWNLAALGYRPLQLVMATSVYSLGVAGGIGAMFRAMARGELPEVTQLVYEARENCLRVLREEAARFGAERVIGNKLSIRELASGMIEVVAIGTAVVPAPPEMRPATPQLIPQAVIVEKDALAEGLSRSGALGSAVAPMAVAQQVVGRQLGAQAAGGRAIGCAIAAMFFLFFGFIACVIPLLTSQ
jgi:uncharacterized protein YbjQ (UPF0145 family)